MNKNQSIGMYVILGIMVLAFISMLFAGPTSSTEELSYTTFLQKVENKEIKSVDMEKDVLVALPVKQPEAKKTDVNPIYGEIKPPKLQYKVAYPENSDILSVLEKNGVSADGDYTISIRYAIPSLVTLCSWVLFIFFVPYGMVYLPIHLFTLFLILWFT